VQGLPVILHGDGTSIWTLTHSKDFAVGLIGLLGKNEAIDQAYHITSEEWLTWNGIYSLLAKELNVTPHIVHIPSDVIARYDQTLGAGLLGDKSHSMIFDNSKIRKLVPDFNPVIPFEQGATEIVEWYRENTQQKEPDESINQLMDTIIRDYSVYTENIRTQSEFK